MRELQFRAWDNKHKRWLNNYPKLGGCDILGEMILLGEWCSTVRLEDLNDIIVEQYTGLKDKNGKEIYEGDILSIQYKRPEYINLVIGWSNDSALFYTSDKVGGGGCACSKDSIKEFEIVGNVHKNPELLEMS